MKIRFKVYCPTRWGQQVFVKIGADRYPLHTKDGIYWEIDMAHSYQEEVNYYYEIHEDDQVTLEFGGDRSVGIREGKSILLSDTWKATDSLENVLYTAPFLKSIFNNKIAKKKEIAGNIQFNLRVLNIPKGQKVGLLGSHELLGSWQEDKLIMLHQKALANWFVDLTLNSANSFEYKYVLCDSKGKLIEWEQGENRVFEIDETSFDQVIIQDEYLETSKDLWRGAGVALPVFSLRTSDSAGVGEFNDIPAMIDWMASVGFRVFQVLPVNDTVASHTWWDSYPYAAISVHALHPIYANMEAIGPLKNKKRWKEICKEANLLNEKKEVAYEEVMKLKSAFFKESYDENKKDFLKGKELKAFLKQNKSWIFDYAVFSCLRDRFHTSDFTQWGEYQSMTDKQIETFCDSNGKDFDDVAVHYYIQYHLDLQLKAATAYARENGVVLKGDIPIGIFRHSVDAWKKPNLFHLDQQAGAPPDMFSDTGQNWGFPTYNWSVMAEDKFSWWKERLQKMGDYFDIIRLDHILGFFRIWQMPVDQIQGLLGIFYPSLPFSVDEIRYWGIGLDVERYCDPLIGDEVLGDISNSELIKRHFLQTSEEGWKFKPAFKSQHEIDSKVRMLIADGVVNPEMHHPLRDEVFRLQSEVLFIRDGKEGYYHPRIDFHNTKTFQLLDEQERNKLRGLHDHYFYHRHNEFWKEGAAKKLPVLKYASDMLVCGEDLGMVPDSVVPLMHELQILQLNVQRNPEYESQFDELHYLSVKGSGNHDMPTLRQWWSYDAGNAARIYYDILHMGGDLPEHLTPEVTESLMQKQFEANSMWVIIPLQDLMPLSNDLVRPEMDEERINYPENPHNAWCYRFHLELDVLKKDKLFNQKLTSLLRNSNRA